MVGQNAFLVHLDLFMCYKTISIFLLVVLVVVVLFVCCCCFVVVAVVALTSILFGSVCVCGAWLRVFVYPKACKFEPL